MERFSKRSVVSPCGALRVGAIACALGTAGLFGMAQPGSASEAFETAPCPLELSVGESCPPSADFFAGTETMVVESPIARVSSVDAADVSADGISVGTVDAVSPPVAVSVLTRIRRFILSLLNPAGIAMVIVLIVLGTKLIAGQVSKRESGPRRHHAPKANGKVAQASQSRSERLAKEQGAYVPKENDFGDAYLVGPDGKPMDFDMASSAPQSGRDGGDDQDTQPAPLFPPTSMPDGVSGGIGQPPPPPEFPPVSVPTRVPGGIEQPPPPLNP